MVKVPGMAAASIVFITALLLFSSCTAPRESETQRRADADSAAGKAGKAAHTVAIKTEKAAAIAEKKLAHAAHQAHEGWKEAARQDKASDR